MRLLVKVYGVDAMIVGYCAVEDRVNAIIVSNGALSAVTLDVIELGRLPKALRTKVRKRARKAQALAEVAAQVPVQ